MALVDSVIFLTGQSEVLNNGVPGVIGALKKPAEEK
jgi:hypothetical protein